MHWRAPWLDAAKEILALAGADITCLLISYYTIAELRLGFFPYTGNGAIVIVVSWLLFSYSIGRYSWTDDQWTTVNSARRFVGTLATGLAVLAIFVGHSWLFQIVDAQTRFRGFLLPLLSIASVLSWVAGELIQANISKKRWIAIGNANEIKTLQKEISMETTSIQDSIELYQSWEWRIAVEMAKRGDGLVIGATIKDDKELEERLLNLRASGKSVKPIVSWCEKSLKRIPPELISTNWLVEAEGFAIRPGNTAWRVKRLFDIVGSVILLVLTSPVIVVAAVFIWLDDRKPIFYKQVRSGLNGKRFTIWKLRSMRVGSEAKGAQWASASDPRITRIGRLIRATRIDELPQLVGVLKGDLSLIGPRPERPEIELELEEQIPHYRIRHWIRPGLSGWAQVCYPYGASVKDSRMKLSYDIYYIRNGGLLLDFAIIFKTIKMIASVKGYKPE